MLVQVLSQPPHERLQSPMQSPLQLSTQLSAQSAWHEPKQSARAGVAMPAARPSTASEGKIAPDLKRLRRVVPDFLAMFSP